MISTRKPKRRPPPRPQAMKTCSKATKDQDILLDLPNEVLTMIAKAVD